MISNYNEMLLDVKVTSNIIESEKIIYKVFDIRNSTQESIIEWECKENYKYVLEKIQFTLRSNSYKYISTGWSLEENLLIIQIYLKEQRNYEVNP
jgi:hypothetical protein